MVQEFSDNGHASDLAQVLKTASFKDTNVIETIRSLFFDLRQLVQKVSYGIFTNARYIYVCTYTIVELSYKYNRRTSEIISSKLNFLPFKKKKKKNGNVQSSPCSDSHLSLRKTKLGKISIDVNFVSEFLECGVLIYL